LDGVYVANNIGAGTVFISMTADLNWLEIQESW